MAGSVLGGVENTAAIRYVPEDGDSDKLTAVIPVGRMGVSNTSPSDDGVPGKRIEEFAGTGEPHTKRPDMVGRVLGRWSHCRSSKKGYGL